MAISSKELAAMLGVSPSAISIALNNKEGISPETRERILKAAKEHGIQKSERLNTGKARSMFINLVIFKKHGMVYGDTPFFSEVIEGISNQVKKVGYSLLVTYLYGNQDRKEQLRSLNLSECAGIILLATEMSEEDIRWFSSANRPVVILDSYFGNYNLDSIVIDNIQGAYLATSHLIEHGHKNIGHLASQVEINNFKERHEGFAKAVNRSSETCDSIYNTIRLRPTTEGAYEDMKAYLGKKPELPTAFFADNDIIAISCIRALKEAGYKIPNDISIVGFDDIPMAYVTSPKLTTVHVAKEILGIRAVIRLIEKINDPSDAALKIAVNTTLEIRESVSRK
ncbi:MAG TPA: LacI family transcriptional regulator [Clostridiales bacterium]|nr:LacI family transcriptional regulator [Clostridiales bacterium]